MHDLVSLWGLCFFIYFFVLFYPSVVSFCHNDISHDIKLSVMLQTKEGHGHEVKGALQFTAVCASVLKQGFPPLLC